MTTTTINEFHERYGEVIAAELARVRPGEIVSPDVEASARAIFESISGLHRDQYLSNPYGYPMMPIPLGGKQRLPQNVNHALMGHPAFWIDEKVGDRREEETEEHWAIRLYMELLARGWWDPHSGEWFDVLQVAEFDMATPAVRRRVEAYCGGAPDADLTMLVIPEIVDGLPDLDLMGPSGYADEMIRILEPVLSGLNQFAADESDRVCRDARELLDSDFGQMSKSLVTALTAYRDAATGGRWMQEWQVASHAAYALRDEIDEVFRSLLDAAGPLLRASAEGEDDYLTGVYALAAEVQTTETERHAQFDSLMLALRDNGREDAAFKALFSALRESHALAVRQLREIFEKVDQINSAGEWHPLEETVPEEAEEILMPGMGILPVLRPASAEPTSRSNGAHSLRRRSASEMFGSADLPSEEE